MDGTPLDTSSGNGCLLWLIGALLVAGVLVGMSAAPKKEDFGEAAKRGVDRSGNDTAQFLSGNEAMSRNQLNLWSDVTNEFYDCNGYGACIIDNSVKTMETTTTETTTDNRTNTTVNGDRNNVYVSPLDGARFCQDEATGQYSPCLEGQ